MPGCGRASPKNSGSMPAMMRSRVDLPEQLRPFTPILAPGIYDSELSLRISRLGVTSLPTRFIVYMYCAISNQSLYVCQRGEHALRASHPLSSERRL